MVHRFLADPVVEVQVADQRSAARARTATGAERTRLWDEALKFWPPYADSQRKTEREIPVVVSDPIRASQGGRVLARKITGSPSGRAATHCEEPIHSVRQQLVALALAAKPPGRTGRLAHGCARETGRPRHDGHVSRGTSIYALGVYRQGAYSVDDTQVLRSGAPADRRQPGTKTERFRLTEYS